MGEKRMVERQEEELKNGRAIERGTDGKKIGECG